MAARKFSVQESRGLGKIQHIAPSRVLVIPLLHNTTYQLQFDAAVSAQEDSYYTQIQDGIGVFQLKFINSEKSADYLQQKQFGATRRGQMRSMFSFISFFGGGLEILLFASEHIAIPFMGAFYKNVIKQQKQHQNKECKYTSIFLTILSDRYPLWLPKKKYV